MPLYLPPRKSRKNNFLRKTSKNHQNTGLCGPSWEAMKLVQCYSDCGRTHRLVRLVKHSGPSGSAVHIVGKWYREEAQPGLRISPATAGWCCGRWGGRCFLVLHVVVGRGQRRKLEIVVFYDFITHADSNTRNPKLCGNHTNYLKISEQENRLKIPPFFKPLWVKLHVAALTWPSALKTNTWLKQSSTHKIQYVK